MRVVRLVLLSELNLNAMLTPCEWPEREKRISRKDASKGQSRKEKEKIILASLPL